MLKILKKFDMKMKTPVVASSDACNAGGISDQFQTDSGVSVGRFGNAGGGEGSCGS